MIRVLYFINRFCCPVMLGRMSSLTDGDSQKTMMCPHEDLLTESNWKGLDLIRQCNYMHVMEMVSGSAIYYLGNLGRFILFFVTQFTLL